MPGSSNGFPAASLAPAPPEVLDYSPPQEPDTKWEKLPDPLETEKSSISVTATFSSRCICLALIINTPFEFK